MKLDLACGRHPMQGYDGVDNMRTVGATNVVDLSQYPWPWDDETVDAIHCSHYVEHVSDLVAFMNEVYRICKPGALVIIRHPYQHSNRAWQDPTHVRALNEVSWAYYNRHWRTANDIDHYLGIVADFDIVDMQYLITRTQEWIRHPPNDLRHLVNVIDDLMVKLVRR